MRWRQCRGCKQRFAEPRVGLGPAWTVRALWEAFAAGVDTADLVPANRFRWEEIYDVDASAAGKSVSKWGSFVQGMEPSIASFFAISPREASVMDPRNRMLLETGWECIESAAHNPLALEQSPHHPVGVYVGTWPSEYGERIQEDQYLQFLKWHGTECCRRTYLVLFALTGNCVAIDTACSS